jgi:hypothetical protein
VVFVITMPAAGSARIVISRAARAGRSALRAAARYKRVGTVTAKLKKGKNTVRVRKLKKRKLAKGSYRATITPKAGGKTLKALRVGFKIRR